MSQIIYISGGARSGKSSWALRLAHKRKGRVAFIATGEPRDKEMKQRIVQHRRDRPQTWTTFEEPTNLSGLIEKIGPDYPTIIIDCLTLWTSNLLLKQRAPRAILSEAARLAESLKKTRGLVIIVTNEVGCGIVPANRLARDFRDIAGRINQTIAHISDTAYFMISGIPLVIKKKRKRRAG
jgi:adenosyl cobinamide kinase/adenosyl cobinamide phosphate guanylyltransferase